MTKQQLLRVTFCFVGLLLAACVGGQGQSAVPGADSVRTFETGQCILIIGDHPAYTSPGPGSIPVGQSLAGEQAVLQAATFSDGSLWYLKDDGVWFSADGSDYETRGDCAP